jgi:hypothetical protein
MALLISSGHFRRFGKTRDVEEGAIPLRSGPFLVSAQKANKCGMLEREWQAV